MRLFVALDLNTTVVHNLMELVQILRPLSPISWVNPRNMHVNLKYVGDWDEDRLDEIVRALQCVRIPSRVRVALSGLSFFPSNGTPRVFWALAENTPGLRQLASTIDTSLTSLGIPPEVTPFVPHVTLGPVHSRDLTEMHEAVEELPSREFGIIEPDSFVLYGSHMSRRGPVHQRIEEFRYMMPVTEDKASRMAYRY